MSGQVIAELFKQIVHSEEKIKERFERLKKVNHDIQDSQNKIKSIKYEREALHGKLNNSRHKLLEEQLEEKWLTIRKGILQQQKDNVSKEKENLLNQLKKAGLVNRQ